MAHWCWPQFVMAHEMFSTTSNSRRCDYSDFPGDGHNRLKEPTTWLKVATTLEKPPTPNHRQRAWRTGFQHSLCCQPHIMGHGQHLNLKWIDGWRMDGWICVLSLINDQQWCRWAKNNAFLFMARPMNIRIRYMKYCGLLLLTHLPMVPHMCVRESGQHRFR